MKKDGRISEAFVFLNHYLDLCEAIEEGEGQLVDHSDLVQTDFPSNIPIPSRMYLADDVKEHDEVREWVLAISMDQKVDQVSFFSEPVSLTHTSCRSSNFFVVLLDILS